MEQFDSHHDVVVIGAGQAGLAMGHHLQRLGLDFVILDGATASATPGGPAGTR
ncbi:MAG TPA: lycopene cyclase family protein [Euzebyales bacterium]|nr:lycopene cyclase family protein [Euzebyales bacterium]